MVPVFRPKSLSASLVCRRVKCRPFSVSNPWLLPRSRAMMRDKVNVCWVVMSVVQQLLVCVACLTHFLQEASRRILLPWIPPSLLPSISYRSTLLSNTQLERDVWRIAFFPALCSPFPAPLGTAAGLMDFSNRGNFAQMARGAFDTHHRKWGASIHCLRCQWSRFTTRELGVRSGPSHPLAPFLSAPLVCLRYRS